MTQKSKKVDDDGCGLETLLKYAPDERRKDVLRYVDEFVKAAEYAFDYEFLGFIADYIAFASILNEKARLHEDRPPWETKQPRPITVYDVGCGGAFQHLVFDKCIHYVGIDMVLHPEPRFFRDHCRFVHGRFSEVIGGLNVDRDNAVGIANMSLLYFRQDDDALELFDKTFKRKIIL